MQATMIEQSFREFLLEFEDSISLFINGDATAWKELASQHYDATIMGAWGGYEQGWDEVSTRYQWAADRFMPSGARVRVEYLSVRVSGDMAYTVANEYSVPLILGQTKPLPMALRVTHLFRLEDGRWKLVHRHADPLMVKNKPDTVLQS